MRLCYAFLIGLTPPHAMVMGSVFVRPCEVANEIVAGGHGLGTRLVCVDLKNVTTRESFERGSQMKHCQIASKDAHCSVKKSYRETAV